MNIVLEKSKLILKALKINLDEEKENMLLLICYIESEKLLNYLNRIDLPKGLIYTLANRVVGKFLLNNLSLGKYESINNLTPEELVQIVNIKEYETSIQYAKNESAYDEKENLIKVLNEMTKYNLTEINRYRVINWT